MTKKSSDYDVGYGKTPTHTRFKPGQSGNKKGRPKGSKNLKTDLKDELNQTISVLMDGKKVKMTKQKAFVKNIVALALKQNHKAMTILLNMYTKFLIEEEAGESDETLSKTEQEILDEFIASVIAEHKAEEKSDE